MTLFQKIQIFSGIIPFYSMLFTFVTTYICCWKNRKNYLLLGIIGILYFSIFFLAWNALSSKNIILAIFICAIISFIGNYCLVRLQIKCISEK